MPPKKTAKNTKKGQNPSPLPVAEDPKPVPEEVTLKPEVLLPPPAQQPLKQEKPVSPAKEPEHKAETQEKPAEEKKTEEGELEKAASVIKLNQFNNFAAGPVGGGKAGGISEEEKKKLREMRFAGKHVAENTFDVSNVNWGVFGLFLVYLGGNIRFF